MTGATKLRITIFLLDFSETVRRLLHLFSNYQKILFFLYLIPWNPVGCPAKKGIVMICWSTIIDLLLRQPPFLYMLLAGFTSPCGPATGVCRTCRPVFGTLCRVWRAPSQLDSSWLAAPHETGTSAPPTPPRRLRRWGRSPAEQTEANSMWEQAWASSAFTRRLQSSHRAPRCSSIKTSLPCSLTLFLSV